MSGPILSVITATHNDERYIKEAVDSILNQSFGDFEYIIVDDGSTDHTYEILSSIKDNRVSVIKNKGKLGPGAARNIALRHAKGEYIAIMDGDDISYPERFGIQMNYIQANPNIAYLGTGVRIVEKETGSFIRDDIYPLSDGVCRWVLLHKAPMIHSTSIGRKDVIIESGLYNEKLLRCQDVDLMRKISKVGSLANLPDILYTYRLRSGLNQKEIVSFTKPYAQSVHTTYIGDLLNHKFEKALINFVWSTRYPIQDDLPDTNIDDYLFNAIAILFGLYTEFRKKTLLVSDREFIQSDLIVWISKIANKSSRYTELLDILLRSDNLTNLSPSSSLLKAWIKSVIRR